MSAEGLRAVNVEAHGDSYPMGNINHGTPERPDWGTFCVECKQSWPCDVSILADRLAAVQAERGAAEQERDDWRWSAQGLAARAESAEAERDAALAALDRVKALADQWDHLATQGEYVSASDMALARSAAAIRAAVEGGAA